MNQIVLVRYGELSIKSEQVRKKFKKILVKNIKSILGELQYEIRKERGRIFVETPEPKEVASRLSNVPGIVSSSPAWETNASIENICKMAEKISEKFFPSRGSFAVRARRTGKHEFSSQDIGEEVGSKILERHPDMNVDLDSPDHEIYVEVRKDDAYIFTDVVEGIGGLPVDTQGKVIALFSGRINSAVSTYLMLKRGAAVYPLFLNPGQKTDGAKNRTLNIAKNLLKFKPDLELRVIPFGSLMNEIPEEIPQEMQWIVRKRMSLLLAEAVGERVGAKGTVSDESLEQLASYGLENLKIMGEKIHGPVLYPLIGLDKNEICKIGRKKIDLELPEKNFHLGLRPNEEPEKLDLEEVLKVEKNISEKTFIKSSLKSMEVHELGGQSWT